MENYFNIEDMVNRMLLNYQICKAIDKRYGIFVHSSVFRKLNESCGKELVGVDYELQIGAQKLDMKYVVLDTHHLHVGHLIYASKCNLPFETECNLFTYSASFHMLEKFIKIYNLDSFVLRIEEQTIPTCTESIKVVYFKDPGIDLIASYLNMINNENFVQRSCYYVTAAFLWLQPSCLDILKYPSNDPTICLGIPPILDHLHVMDGLNALNIFDLISLRLSFCDWLGEINLDNLKSEIDYYINRKLKAIQGDVTYVTGGHFDLKKYVNDHSVLVKDKMIADYFLCKFQNYVESVNLDQTKLVTEVTIIHLTSNNLINFDNTHKNINLRRSLNCNISGKWLADICHMEGELLNNNMVLLTLPNGIEYRFCLTKASSNLIRNMNLDSYVTVIFQKLKIESQFLILLKRISVLTVNMKWLLENCSVEKDPEIWKLMNDSDLLEATIIEDEYTWQSMFDFVAQELIRTKLNKFRFRIGIKIVCDNITIDLREIHFFTETESFLELRTLDGKFIDLYCLKNGLAQDDRPDFE